MLSHLFILTKFDRITMEQLPESQLNRYMQIDVDKYFFASYLNLARHNVFITMNQYLNRVGKGIKDDAEIISSLDILKANKKPEESLKLISHLEKRFPFALPMIDDIPLRLTPKDL